VRAVKQQVISNRVGFVRRVARMSNQYPWQWTSAEVEAFFTDLTSGGRPPDRDQRTETFDGRRTTHGVCD
jgi:hypothetical protein